MNSGVSAHRWRRGLIAFAALALVGCGSVAILSDGSTPSTPNGSGASGASASSVDGAQWIVHADHPTYASLGNLVGWSQVIVAGTVASSAPTSPIAPADPSSPAIPQTDYSVVVDKRFKGAPNPGDTITVDVATDEGEVHVEGAPDIAVGGYYMFFLIDGRDGKFYPLAGDAAIAPRTSDGSFNLPVDVTGDQPLTFAATEIANARPDHVDVKLVPGNRISGTVRSGGVSIARNAGRPTAITGASLVAGHAITFKIVIRGLLATGSFAIDGTSYVATPTLLVRARSTTISMTGAVRAAGKVRVATVAVRGH